MSVLNHVSSDPALYNKKKKSSEERCKIIGKDKKYLNKKKKKKKLLFLGLHENNNINIDLAVGSFL